MTREHVPVRKLVWVVLFAIALAFVESSIVVYLRALYYPDGFSFPLKMISTTHLAVELMREAATIVMLVSIGIVAGGRGWQKFGYFCIAFGVWDIFYYVWLKVILDWPASLTNWDILFLIPVPWIGPVVSAGLIAALLVVVGVDIVYRTSLHKYFSPTILSWLLAFLGTAVILYSFVHDTDATIRGSMPQPYLYELLVPGLALYIGGYIAACRPRGASMTTV